MLILPIKLISSEDKQLVGEAIYNLSKLARNKFPVADGLVVFPPDFGKILQRLNIKNQEDLQNHKKVLENLMYQIPVPKELIQELEKKMNYDDILRLWESLLDNWFEKMSKHFDKFLAEVVFFTGTIKASGAITMSQNLALKPYIDQKLLHKSYQQDSKIVLENGDIAPAVKKQVEDLANRMDKLLGILQTYHFIIVNKDGKEEIKIIKLAPPIINDLKVPNDSLSILHSNLFNRQKSLSFEDKKPTSLKLFLDYSKDMEFSSYIDGLYIRSEVLSSDVEKREALFTSADNLAGKTVIFRLDSIPQDSEILLEARNKNKLLNVQVGIANCMSTFEFMNLKRELASFGIARKGSLKLWLELTTPANLLNIEEYISLGLDGVVIDLEEIAKKLNGAQDNLYNSPFEINALLKFLEESFRILHKLKIPIICMGKIVTLDEVLKFLFIKGAYGVIISHANSIIYEDMLWVQKRAHRSLLS